MVVFDTSIILLSIRPDVNPPINKVTGKPVDYAKERVDGLIEKLDKEKTKIIIPTPALSELLVRAGGDAAAILSDIQKSPIFKIVPFDNRAAIEVSLMTRQAIDKGNKRGAASKDCTWAKVKYDRQIIAIAKVNGATTIYSDDGDILAHANNDHLNVIRLIDIPIPQEDRQAKLDLEKHQIDMIEVVKNNEEDQTKELTQL